MLPFVVISSWHPMSQWLEHSAANLLVVGLKLAHPYVCGISIGKCPLGIDPMWDLG